jgi:hypothetical protein
MAAIPPISVLKATPMALVMDLGSRDRIITRSKPKSLPATALNTYSAHACIGVICS